MGNKENEISWCDPYNNKKVLDYPPTFRIWFDINNNLYISDIFQDKIKVFDKKGRYIKYINIKVDHKLYLGSIIGQDDYRNLYFLHHDNIVHKLDKEGIYVRSYDMNKYDERVRINQISIDREGNIYLWGERSKIPNGVYSDKEKLQQWIFYRRGRIEREYFIQKFDKDGRKILKWKIGDGLPFSYSVIFDRMGKAYIYDKKKCRVHIYNPDGNLIKKFQLKKNNILNSIELMRINSEGMLCIGIRGVKTKRYIISPDKIFANFKKIDSDRVVVLNLDIGYNLVKLPPIWVEVDNNFNMYCYGNEVYLKAPKGTFMLKKIEYPLRK
ncbi:MAG: hypothetical protein AB1422_07010 [bacterium]